jgi:Ca2+-transporting ATPase
MPNWQELALEDVFANLQTVKGGLTDEEAAYRLQKFGPNELKEEKKISALHIFLSQFTNFLVIF